jgi:hypothetical protein
MMKKYPVSYYVNDDEDGMINFQIVIDVLKEEDKHKEESVDSGSKPDWHIYILLGWDPW